MCDHERVLDDFRSGHGVCVDCGRVMDEDGALLGRGPPAGGDQHQAGRVLPAVWRCRSVAAVATAAAADNGDDCRLPDRVQHFGKELIWHVLSKFHMENNQETRERAIDLFERVLLSRRQRAATVGQMGKGETGKAGRLAVAFALARTMNELDMPRPLESLVQLCELHNVKEVLKFGMQFHAGELGEAGPEAHVYGLCAVLAVPYRLAHSTRQLMDQANIKHRLYGSRPHHIAGGTILAVCKQACKDRVWNNSLSLQDICKVMDCRPNCIKRVLEKVPDFSFCPGSRPPTVVLASSCPAARAAVDGEGGKRKAKEAGVEKEGAEQAAKAFPWL